MVNLTNIYMITKIIYGHDNQMLTKLDIYPFLYLVIIGHPTQTFINTHLTFRRTSDNT